MPAYLEVWRPEGAELVSLEAGRVTLGRSATNDVVLASDGKASRLHAALERLAAGWCIRDLTSRNGTFVNGMRIDRDRPLQPGDEIQVGSTRLVFRAERSAAEQGVTEGAERPPDLTPREREVLVALYRPAQTSEVFAEPASTRAVAADLAVSEAAVKQHLARLYDKFGIVEGERRRLRLANEALRRGAINMADIRKHREQGPGAGTGR
ncbi:MAG: FHA domain-containing protein [Acidimicrobiales bacterium]